jgi:hypothetical protein
MAATRFGGNVVLIGALAHEGGDPGTAPMVGRNIRATRIYVGSRVMFEDMNRALAQREVHPVIDRVFVEEAGAATVFEESQQHFGKVVVAFDSRMRIQEQKGEASYGRNDVTVPRSTGRVAEVHASCVNQLRIEIASATMAELRTDSRIAITGFQGLYV